ncbi:hypothetical protein RZS08_04080, partial [Arthrospira platensis SPKY1]|nr:hypothetical protein [Arthrospira platensis SPKY1]
NPKGWNYSGSQVAAPVFREISDKIFALRLFHPDERENKNALAEYPSLRNLHTDDLKPIYAAFGARIRHIPDSQWSHTQAASDSIRLTGVRIAEGKMPDVRGMGLRDALYLLENKGLRVRYTGRG